MVGSPIRGWSAIQGRDIVPGAQTERRGGAGPAGACLAAGSDRRLSVVILTWSLLEQAVAAGATVEEVQARTAEKPVVAQAAKQNVVAQPAEQEVVAGAAVEVIVTSVAEE